MADSSSKVTQIKQFFWPSDPQKKASMKKHYKAIGLFVVSTVVLIKYGRNVADQIYNHSMLEESIKASLN